MAVIAIVHARPGMVLYDGVNDDGGRLLVPAGKELTDALLKSLQGTGRDRGEHPGRG